MPKRRSIYRRRQRTLSQLRNIERESRRLRRQQQRRTNTSILNGEIDIPENPRGNTRRRLVARRQPVLSTAAKSWQLIKRHLLKDEALDSIGKSLNDEDQQLFFKILIKCRSLRNQLVDLPPDDNNKLQKSETFREGFRTILWLTQRQSYNRKLMPVVSYNPISRQYLLDISCCQFTGRIWLEYLRTNLQQTPQPAPNRTRRLATSMSSYSTQISPTIFGDDSTTVFSNENATDLSPIFPSQPCTTMTPNSDTSSPPNVQASTFSLTHEFDNSLEADKTSPPSLPKPKTTVHSPTINQLGEQELRDLVEIASTELEQMSNGRPAKRQRPSYTSQLPELLQGLLEKLKSSK